MHASHRNSGAEVYHADSRVLLGLRERTPGIHDAPTGDLNVAAAAPTDHWLQYEP